MAKKKENCFILPRSLAGPILKSPMPKWRFLRRIQSPWPTLEKPHLDRILPRVYARPRRLSTHRSTLTPLHLTQSQGKFRPDWTLQIGRNNKELPLLIGALKQFSFSVIADFKALALVNQPQSERLQLIWSNSAILTPPFRN